MSRLYTDDAELYDIAFDWDIGAEADWLVGRLGAASVLEPGCGGGRMLGALAQRGVEVLGLDVSPRMVEISRRRLGSAATIVEGDMTDFDLGRTFAGAVSPINTLLHLTPEELAAHLGCMSRHLDPGAAYLVQVGLVAADQRVPFAGSHWEAHRGGVTLRIDWVDELLDPAAGRSLQRSRIEVVEGPGAGRVVEELHEMTAWTPETWARAIGESPFTERATYDGSREGVWPEVGRDATGGLLWHELVRDAPSAAR